MEVEDLMGIGRGKYRVKVGYHFCVGSTQIRSRRLFNGFTRMHVWTNTHTQLSDASTQAVLKARDVVQDVVTNKRGSSKR